MTSQPILYEKPEPGIARIWLNRAEAANAQDTQFLYELSAALDRGAREDDVRVIIVAAKGKHFSAGHDVRERNHLETQDRYTPIGNSNQHHRAGAEGRMSREEELYTGLSERWRNLPKATIAAVHGKCVSGGLLLCWPCDLIIASDDAQFQEVTVAMGIAGVEWFAHPWEMGARKAKEMLMTGAPIGAEEARQLGMVNKVVPRADLASAARDMADKARLAAGLEALIWPHLAAGRIRPVIDRAYPLAEAGKAQARMEKGAHIGKIVLEIG